MVAVSHEGAGDGDDGGACIHAIHDLGLPFGAQSELHARRVHHATLHYLHHRPRLFELHGRQRHQHTLMARRPHHRPPKSPQHQALPVELMAIRIRPSRDNQFISGETSLIVPARITPPAISSLAVCPGRSLASTASGTSASSSTAPSLMMRNSGSAPMLTTDPSLATRRLTTPPTGATMSACASLTASSCFCACANARSALAEATCAAADNAAACLVS